jgi:hypothetical protein
VQSSEFKPQSTDKKTNKLVLCTQRRKGGGTVFREEHVHPAVIDMAGTVLSEQTDKIT